MDRRVAMCAACLEPTGEAETSWTVCGVIAKLRGWLDRVHRPCSCCCGSTPSDRAQHCNLPHAPCSQKAIPRSFPWSSSNVRLHPRPPSELAMSQASILRIPVLSPAPAWKAWWQRPPFAVDTQAHSFFASVSTRRRLVGQSPPLLLAPGLGPGQAVPAATGAQQPDPVQVHSTPSQPWRRKAQPPHRAQLRRMTPAALRLGPPPRAAWPGTAAATRAVRPFAAR